MTPPYKRTNLDVKKIFYNYDINEELDLIKSKKEFVKHMTTIIWHYSNAVENTESFFGKFSNLIQIFSDFHDEEKKHFEYIVQQQKTTHIAWFQIRKHKETLEIFLEEYRKRYILLTNNIKKAMKSFSYAPDRAPYEKKLNDVDKFFNITYADIEKFLVWYELLLGK